ncbi:LOG family protein [Nocardioides jiangxiensis]|uniref:Rossmann fold nucleotide-binding protein n=1 Tax=Nocardioides jiangxiensis TaxID=3064524 RepID=A0ABT9B4A9_9ACTN|nr:Rossmann fold nucleotide-binding protein [Nocardioides sp. WY-20]MDO7869220.1 Rossmann fold nucleotide-binding protein [Nocardioides sp. WY-20]
MKRRRGQVVEIHDLTDFDERVRAGVVSMTGWVITGLDLRDREDVLAGCRVAGAMFLGCRLTPASDASLEARGALVFPAMPTVPVDTWPARLYTPDDLYDTPAYRRSLDARAYAWSRETGREAALARALHDHGIDTALAAWTKGRSLVGVMGGHASERGSADYAEAARLGQGLSGSRTVATGGGPGAMEAANLGAWLSRRPAEALEEALALLGRVPSFRPDVGAWVDAAFEVRDRWPDGGESLGIPTWHYGHEPPNAFATSIAKYFGNPVREAILLQICNAGIVFLPGAGGTVQEIFQDACENYYADASSVAPMVLVGRVYWTETFPAWPLLQALAKGRPMEPHVHLVDTVDEAVSLLG